jgi:hypothetical protein
MFAATSSFFVLASFSGLTGAFQVAKFQTFKAGTNIGNTILEDD